MTVSERAAGPAQARGQSAGETPALSRWVIAVAAIQIAVLLGTATRYGYHRDELYFIVAGGHPAFGYPDQPPLVPLLCRAMNAIAPGSLLLLRTPSALAAGATTVLSALIAREVGGNSRGQLIAAVCTACSGFSLAVSHLVSTSTFDMLSTVTLGWLAIRAVMCRSGASVLAAGGVVGLGVEAKPQVGLVAIVLVASLACLGPRDVLRSRWTVAAGVCAVALAAPYVIWQQVHGWPQLTVAGNIAGTQEGGRAGFFPFQLVMVSPVLVPVWVAGLRAPFRDSRLRPLRFVPLTYGLMAVLYFAGNGHAYYLASLYPILLGLGGPATAAWCSRSARRRGALTGAVLLSAVLSGIIALPLLPERDLQGSVVMALNSNQGEMVGWPRFVRTVRSAWDRLGAQEQTHTAIFTANYGEAGAIDVLAHHLPRAYSGHNGFSEWGEPPAAADHALLVGWNGPSAARPYFSGCRTLARVNDGVGLNNQEQGLPVMICRTAAAWRRLWPRLRHFD